MITHIHTHTCTHKTMPNNRKIQNFLRAQFFFFWPYLSQSLLKFRDLEHFSTAKTMGSPKIYKTRLISIETQPKKVDVVFVFVVVLVFAGVVFAVDFFDVIVFIDLLIVLVESLVKVGSVVAEILLFLLFLFLLLFLLFMMLLLLLFWGQ